MEKIGRYRIVSTIGEGAMGIVYHARDPIIERDVAIKVFKIDASTDRHEELRRRFLAEAKAIGRLDHPAIVTIYDAGFTERGLPYLVMEYVRGEPLTNILVRGEALPVSRLIEMFRELLDALAYAHQQGIVHRDIKPANIMVTEQGRPKLMDFGIAKVLDETTSHQITQSGMIIGTPGYMSPEQVSGRAVGPASDLFSLAVVFWECLTLKKAFEADTIAAVAFKIVYENLPDPRKYNQNCPVALSAVLARALEKKPERRFSSAEAFRDALNMVLQRTWRLTLTQRLRWLPRNHRVRFWAGLMLILGLLMAGGLFYFHPGGFMNRRVSGERPPAREATSPPVVVKESPGNGVPLTGPVKKPLVKETEHNDTPGLSPAGGDQPQARPEPSKKPLANKTETSRTERSSRPAETAKRQTPRPSPVRPESTPEEGPETTTREPTVSRRAPISRSRGYLTVRVANFSARVYLDGKLIGRTPLERFPIPARARSYRVEIVGPGGKTLERRVLILPNKEYTIEHDFKVRGVLVIRVNKPARVYVDDRFIGLGNQEVRNLPVGLHRIKVVWENQTHEEKVFVEYPGPTRWEYRFRP